MPQSSPVGLPWRSSTTFILSVVAMGLLSDFFIYGLILPILPFFLRDRLRDSPDKIQNHVSVLIAAFSLACLVFALPAGWITDWTSTRRLPYLAGLLLLTAASILFLVSKNFWLFLLSRILQGMSAAIVNAAGLAMIVDTVGSKNLGRTIGTVQSFVAIGELAGPPVGGFLYAWRGTDALLAASMTVIAIDFIMRLFVIEKKVARTYENTQSDVSGIDDDGPAEVTEEVPLLASSRPIKVAQPAASLTTLFPIFACLSSPRLLTALFLGFIQALILGSFDATLAIEVGYEFDFSSQQAGAMFLLCIVPGLFVAPLAGIAVDRYGTRAVATWGFAIYALCLASLRVPSMGLGGRGSSILVFCVILVFNGICTSIVSTSSVVEAQNVVEEYVKESPESFGPNGPYGQLFGCTGLAFNAGLTIGPILAGLLRNAIGYGNMYAVIAGLSALAAALAFFFIGKRSLDVESE